jgi:hypothetical protein
VSIHKIFYGVEVLNIGDSLGHDSLLISSHFIEVF